MTEQSAKKLQTSHTSGPWHVGEEVGDSGDIFIEDDDGTRVAFATWEGEYGDHVLERTEANARLIAAAPDLLGVAERVIFIAENSNAGAWHLRGLLDDARAAIARATGTS